MKSQVFPVKPEQFWAAFSNKLRLDWNDQQKQVSQFYNHAKPWTSYITGLVKNLSVEFACIADTEYWPRIDVVYFDRVREDWGEWALEVAIELENDESWCQELSKLLMVNAGLKVLIAYEHHLNLKEILSHFIDIHKSRKYMTENCEWLLVFGPRVIPASHDFVAFKFDGKVIVDITDSKQTLF